MITKKSTKTIATIKIIVIAFPKIVPTSAFGSIPETGEGKTIFVGADQSRS